MSTKARIKAVIKNPHGNGRNYGGEKELVSAYTLVAKKGRVLAEAVTVRVYMGRSRNASTVYASVWVSAGKEGTVWVSGTGKAGGYGYCKESSAIAAAITDAGIELYGCPYGGKSIKERLYFGGTGMSRLHDILAAIAKAQGFNISGSILVTH